MGAVYRAHRGDGHFEQKVAIKIIDTPLASTFFRERFRAERQMLAGLAHPYIARLFDGGVTSADELYLVMEYVDGQCITDFCKHRNLSLEDRLRLFIKVCEAVQYAHRNLIVHRDLKPENILVAEDSTPRLLDFGTAKIVHPLSATNTGDATRADLRTFTPRYASPEQVLDQPISIATDVYSLGVLLYVLLTNQTPYVLTNFSTEELVRVICGEQPRRPSATSSPFGRIDADLDSIVLKLLRKDPKERYSTVESLAADIQAYLDHMPVQARRGNLRYLAGKFAKRMRVPPTCGN
jgi:serine/threonine protein kinase